MAERFGPARGGSASGRRLAVERPDDEAILPRRRRIVIGALPGGDGAAGVEAAGGIIRMSAWHSSRIAGYPAGAPG